MRPIHRATCVGLLVALSSCGGGGGGGGGGNAALPVVDLGTVAATGSTRKVLSADNPFNASATASAGPVTGPFAFDPSDLPASAAAAATLAIGVFCVPVGPDPMTGTLTVHWTPARGSAVDVTYSVLATPEAGALVLVTPTLDFGEVLENTTKQLSVRIRNPSTSSTATITNVSSPPSGFALVSGTLPLTIAPGATAGLPVRCVPTGIGVAGGTLTIGAGDPGGPLLVTLASTTGGEVVRDFGTQTLDGTGRTSLLSVDVPADAISLSLEGVMAAGNVGLAELTGPGGRVYENAAGTGAYVWIPSDVFTATVPNTDRSPVQLVAGGGTYTFKLYRLSGTGSTMSVRALVERRPGGTGSVGRLDLDVWLANVITPKAATAATDTRLQAVLDSIDSILGAAGVHLGDIRYHDVTDPTYDDVTDAEFGPMLTLTSAAPSPRLNLFFVRTALGGGVLGVSATIAGPQLNGTQYSGVMSLYDGYPAATIGLVAAHEIGHYLGLYHTVEQDGTHDFIDDTADCPATGTNAVCPTEGGGLLMHWQAVGGTMITAGQAHVILGHPDVEPAIPGGAALRALRLDPILSAYPSAAAPLPDGWCGTCRRVALPTPK